MLMTEMSDIKMTEKDEHKTVETGILRKNLSDILESVKHHELRRVDVSKHKKIQASVIPADQADLIFDLSDEKLEEMHEALGVFLDKRRSSKRKKVGGTDLGDILRSVN